MTPCACAVFSTTFTVNSPNTKAMFSSSLRKKTEWVQALRLLCQSPSKWKESNQLEHDIEFPIEYSPTHTSTFRMILLSTEHADTEDALHKIEQLCARSEGKRGVVVLMQGHNATSAFMKLQLRMLEHGTVSVMPISSAIQLIPLINTLRSQVGVNKTAKFDKLAIQKDVLRHMVLGSPLSAKQVDALLNASKTLGELARVALTQEGQQHVCELIGEIDGGRLIAYLTNGPTPV